MYEAVRVYCQRYLLATLDDTNKVERFWHFCAAYLPITDVQGYYPTPVPLEFPG
jgi:hypothetical protein